MNWETIIVQAIIMFGAGGVGAAIVNGLFNKVKTDAEAELTEQAAITELLKASNKMCDTMQTRIDILHKRVETVEAKLKERDTVIEALTKENRALKSQVEELERERNHQIELNRSQGQKIGRLTRQLEEANKRIRQLEERLGERDA
jgi:predicted RNase H-like nuclease (RuvC/YqgF family)